MADDTTSHTPYDVEFTPAARRAVTDLLPPAAAFAVYEFIVGPLADNPHRVGAPLGAPFEGLHRARRGVYRVRYEIDEQRHRVTILAIAHRRDAYRT